MKLQSKPKKTSLYSIYVIEFSIVVVIAFLYSQVLVFQIYLMRFTHFLQQQHCLFTLRICMYFICLLSSSLSLKPFVSFVFCVAQDAAK